MPEDDEHAQEEDIRTPREKASKIPSWIMVGFILGALTFYTVSDYLGRPKQTPPAETTGAGVASSTIAPTFAGSPQTAPSAPAPEPRPAPQPPDTETKFSPLLDNSMQMTLFAIDAVFRKWAVNAMWEYNTTQVVFWNPRDETYSAPVEVFRVGTDETGYDYFYRRIDRPTRTLVRDPIRPDAPILFTETEEATRRRKATESWWR
ncbi:MAG: hypothetical protein LBM04_00855, partial [Opitutaceae bacterium]|nr:hypothetical protein [Opitutaceae bacterium]